MVNFAYLPIEDFADAVTPTNAGPRVLAMLVAYFDASKTQLRRPYVAVAGCLANLNTWKLFQPEWQSILNDEGLPFFHMTDFEAYKNDYKGWTKERHEKCLIRLGTVMVNRTEFAYGRGVALDDWEYAKTKNEVLNPWSAFTYCANQCFHSIAIWANEHNHIGPISYIVESGDGYNGELIKLKDDIESSPTRRMRFRWAGLHILPKLADALYPLTPLQAADVWAFETRKEWENKYAVGDGERLHPVRHSIKFLLQSGAVKHDMGFSTRENLVNLQPYWFTERE